MQIVNCPIATDQNLGFDNTKPSQMDSVDMFPSLLFPTKILYQANRGSFQARRRRE